MNEQFDKKPDSVYSKRLKAGKRRTYFFDVRATRGFDYFLTITESRKRQMDDGYDRHKIFLYKEDFHKFLKGLNEAISYVKTELMPDFDFDSFNHEQEQDEYEGSQSEKPQIAPDLLSTAKMDGDGITHMDGHEKQPQVDGKDGFDGHDGKPAIEGMPILKTNVAEEVDKW